MRMVTRRDWGGPATIDVPLRVRQVSLVVVHHTGARARDYTPHEECAQTLAWHQQHIGQGWSGIGYGFVVYPSGRVHEGRGFGRVGAHAKGVNSTSIGVAFALDGERESPSLEAIASYTALRQHAVAHEYLAAEHRVEPHRKYTATTCPGRRLLAVMPVLTAPVFLTPEAPRLLRRGMTGDDVWAVQIALVRTGHMTAAQMASGPGVFGAQMERAVRAAQEAAGIAVDGIVGRHTLKAIGL